MGSYPHPGGLHAECFQRSVAPVLPRREVIYAPQECVRSLAIALIVGQQRAQRHAIAIDRARGGRRLFEQLHRLFVLPPLAQLEGVLEDQWASRRALGSLFQNAAHIPVQPPRADAEHAGMRVLLPSRERRAAGVDLLEPLLEPAASVVLAKILFGVGQEKGAVRTPCP